MKTPRALWPLGVIGTAKTQFWTADFANVPRNERDCNIALAQLVSHQCQFAFKTILMIPPGSSTSLALSYR